MFSAIYTGLSGLISFAKGLDVISNNVANLNTPGFKSSQLYFEDLYYQYNQTGGNNSNRSSLQLGAGVNATSTKLRFAQGDLRGTNNPLDVAIDGNGFFVLRDNGKTSYTRDGEFNIDADGYLAEKNSKARIASLVSGNTLADINISGLRASGPQATSAIKFTGNLSSGSQTAQIQDIVVYDSHGTSQKLTIDFTNNSSTTPGSWTYNVKDSGGNTLTTGEIQFEGNGSPKTGFNTHTFTLTSSGSGTSEVTLNFGEPGSFVGATNFSGGTSSDIKAASTDGRAPGALTKVGIDEDGYLVITYSNGQTVKGEQIALAWFDNLSNLEQIGGGLFTDKGSQTPRFAAAGQDVMGKLAPGKIELSNVQLTEQFTDLIVVQRGYQASSQVISVGNEMMQQLLDLKGRR
jgi:flagellar hook protein FlgE